jgi:hypothetical protein
MFTKTILEKGLGEKLYKDLNGRENRLPEYQFLKNKLYERVLSAELAGLLSLICITLAILSALEVTKNISNKDYYSAISALLLTCTNLAFSQKLLAKTLSYVKNGTELIKGSREFFAEIVKVNSCINCQYYSRNVGINCAVNPIQASMDETKTNNCMDFIRIKNLSTTETK